MELKVSLEDDTNALSEASIMNLTEFKDEIKEITRDSPYDGTSSIPEVLYTKMEKEEKNKCGLDDETNPFSKLRIQMQIYLPTHVPMWRVGSQGGSKWRHYAWNNIERRNRKRVDHELENILSKYRHNTHIKLDND